MPTAMQEEKPLLLSPVTEEDLGRLQVHLPALKILSYRGPGESGGVSRSLEPVVRQLGTKIHWIALSGVPSPGEEKTAGFSFHKPTLPAPLVYGHGKSALEYLWPLLHGMPERAKFDPADWRAFRQLSEYMATEALRISTGSFPTLCWLHDYHMALVAPLMSIEAGIVPCQFWHVPWPQADVIAASPIAREITSALLSNKLLGFHTQEYATNFLNTVMEVIPGASVDVLNMQVRLNRSVTRIVTMPLGLDFAYWQRLSKASRPKAAAMSKKYGLAHQVVLGVDSLDYTKGVIEKLQGLQSFLSNNPSWLRRFHYVQLAQPPQSSMSEFSDYASLVRAQITEINHRFRADGWEPVVLLEEQFDHGELAAWYQAADVLLVTPVRDGLNLIGKEYVACRQDEQGALILSRSAGSSAELSTGALLVDPTKPDQIAESLVQALAMGFEEKRRRMHSMRHIVGWNQLHDWALGFLRLAIS